MDEGMCRYVHQRRQASGGAGGPEWYCKDVEQEQGVVLGTERGVCPPARTPSMHRFADLHWMSSVTSACPRASAVDPFHLTRSLARHWEDAAAMTMDGFHWTLAVNVLEGHMLVAHVARGVGGLGGG